MKYTLLHIEDDPALTNLVKMAFKSFGFRGEMLSVCSVHEALYTLTERARLQKPLALILTDMQLPDGTGLEVINAVKLSPVWRLTPVAVLSGEKSDKVVSDAYAMGANCFLPKIAKTKPVLDILRSLYDCWLKNAVLPEGTAAGSRLQAILAAWIRHRAQQANLYMNLSQAFAEDPSLSEFWLNLALNEGNLTNIAVFFQHNLGGDEMPQEGIERFAQMQVQIDAALHTAEQFLKENPRLTVQESLTIILDILEAINETTTIEFIHHMLPRNPMAARAFQSVIIDHFAKVASFIAGRSELPNLSERATAIAVEMGKLNKTQFTN